MARSVEEVFNGMVSYKNQMQSLVGYTPSLNGVNAYQFVLQKLNTNSYVSLWLLIFWIVATGIHTSEVLRDSFKQEVLTLIANFRPATLLWYRQQAYLFQYQDELLWIDNRYQYLTDNPAARIIAQCSVTEPNGRLRIKVAKADGAGGLMALTTDELQKLTWYYQRIKYPGTKIDVISAPADLVYVLFKFQYDALLDLPTLQAVAWSAIQKYLSSLKFDGSVNLNAIIDALQAVDGIVDAVPETFNTKYGIQAYTSYLAQGEYPTYAGYAVLDADPAYQILFNDSNRWTAV